MTDLPVLILVFKRPHTTIKVLEQIRKVRPKKLYVVADGPRNEEERIQCEQTRALFDKLDWDCEVIKNFADKNMGCKNRVASGVTWFFEQVERGVILEDDIIVDPSFFEYCSVMLEKYKDDERIMHIGAANFQDGKKRGKASYFFTKYHQIYGWASWRRAWKPYDVNISSLPIFKESNILKEICQYPGEEEFWLREFDECYSGRKTTWDMQWVYTIWNNHGWAITPQVNLSKNIGFDDSSANWTDDTVGFSTIKVKSISKIIHPTEMKIDREADKYTANRLLRFTTPYSFLDRCKDSCRHRIVKPLSRLFS